MHTQETHIHTGQLGRCSSIYILQQDKHRSHNCKLQNKLIGQGIHRATINSCLGPLGHTQTLGSSEVGHDTFHVSICPHVRVTSQDTQQMNKRNTGIILSSAKLHKTYIQTCQPLCCLRESMSHSEAFDTSVHVW